MGFFSKFEGKMEDTFEGAADRLANAPLSPVQIAKKAEKQMHREKMVGAGKQYAPTLYTVLVNPNDDERLFGYYPTLAGETETYLAAKAAAEGLVMDGQPLVRFIVDDGLRHGKFDVVAEAVASPLIEQLRQEEMERYGLATNSNGAGIIGSASAGVGRGAGRTNAQNASGYGDGYGALGYGSGYEQDAAYNNTPYSKDNYGAFANNMASENNYAGANYNPESEKPPLPYVPEDEIDYSLDYGEYTFNSQDFNDYRENGPASVPLPRKNNSAPHDSVAPHDSLGALSSEDARSFEDAHVSPVGTAVNNTAEEMVGVGKDAASAGVAGAGVVGAGAAGVGAGAAGANVVSADVEPQFPAQAQAQPQTPAYPQTPSQASVQAPATMVFAAGGNAGQPQAQLSNSAVRAHLIDTTNNRTYSLACARLIIGRERSCDIKLPDINASRTHAEIRYEPQGVWSITDLGSTNGTSVNGRGVSSQTLYPGDTITIGMTNLVFELA